MNIIKWNKIYKRNKELDYVFHQKYGNDVVVYQKNCIEFLVELGEFVNETKVFKYWSIKRPNIDKMLSEYADVITMCLYFYREFMVEIDDRYLHIKSDSILEVINYLYGKISLLINNQDKELIKNIFYNILYLGELLKLNEDEVLNAIEKKHQIIEERLNSDY